MLKKECNGFALPSIMIASIVMLIVLATAISSVTTTRTSLDSQYHEQLAREAAESGIQYARNCLNNSNDVVTWSNSKPLKSNTDCNGTVQLSCPTTLRNPRCGVVDSALMRTTFSVGTPVDEHGSRTFTATGSVELLRASNSDVWKRVEHVGLQTVVQTQDLTKSRASQRFWYFGNAAGLDFGTSGTTTTPITAACGSACLTTEGVTVATDSRGDLLFWTDGRTVWNRDGDVMQNSTGLNGDASATQASAFFPLDKSLTKYVIVTNTAEYAAGAGTLYYSVIDMTLDGGKGGVMASKKNVPVWTGVTGYTTEALTAAPKSDGSGFWVVAFRPGTTNLIVAEFDASGPVGTPREFSSGMTISRRTTSVIGVGTLNFNNDYTKLVMMAGSHCAGSTACPTDTGLVRLIDFDARTGTPTNRYAWDGATTFQLASNANHGYSADFSPGEQYIYLSRIYSGRLYRYKLAGNSSSAAIKSSEEFIGITNSATDYGVYNGGGQVLSAPDGRMYVANLDFQNISVVNKPDAATTVSMTLAQRQSAVGFVYNGITLRPGTVSRYGLPQMVTVYTPKVIAF